MLVFPNCKINLGLRITGKRADGYHDIETIFYPVQLNDALEIIQWDDAESRTPVEFTHSGLPIDGAQEDNLCSKAYHLLKKDFPQLPRIKIHLHKAIPMGAGLGGGSADAAYTLIALNEKFALNISAEQLSAYSLQLGSDCPFFMLNKPFIATGRGEILQAMNIPLTGYQLILINPGIHVNTAWAFSQWAFSQFNIEYDCLASKGTSTKSLQSIISKPIGYWKEELVNDFEKPVFEKYPEIKSIKDTLYANGALFASMSGSGSSVYGIFEKNAPDSFNFPGSYRLSNILL